MTPLRRTAATVAAVLLTVLLASCGVDAGDAATGTATTTTEPSDLSPLEQEMVDTMAKTYRDLGFTDEEADCLAKGMAGVMGGPSDPAGAGDIMDIINECDIPISRFTDIQGDLGAGDVEDTTKESMKAGFKNLGMTEEQADCVATAFLDEYGPDLESMQDPTALQPLFEDCGVDIFSLQPGG